MRNNKITILDLEQAQKDTAAPLDRHNAAFITSLSGISCQVVLFFYFSIKKRSDYTTGPLSLVYLATVLKVKANTLKNTIMRLQKKHYIVRKVGKAGRGGWVNFKLADNLYQALNRQEALGALKQMQTVVPDASNTCLSILPAALPEAWQSIDYSVLMEVGFNETHLQQLYEMQTLDALTVQNSIYHFAFDLKHNNKKAQIRRDSLNYFMGILSKRAYNAPSNYVHPDIEAWQDYWHTEQQNQQQREAWETKVQALEFKSWYEQLSDEEIKSLTLEIPENAHPNIRQTLELRFLKKYFVEAVWPLKCREILRTWPNWKNGYQRVQTTKTQET